MTTNEREVVDVPLTYPTTTIFLDESGVKAKDRFTVGGFKVRRVGELGRAIRDLRDQHQFFDEFKFNDVNDGSLEFTYGLVDILEASDAQIIGCVVDATVSDPFVRMPHRWLAHVDVASQLLIGAINRRELVTVLIDSITIPKGCSLEDSVRGKVNRKFGATSVVSAVCLDSKTTDMLQLADLVASSIAFERRRMLHGIGSPTSAKGKVAARLGAAIGNAGLVDGRGRRFNIATYRAPQARDRRRLTVVESGRSA